MVPTPAPSAAAGTLNRRRMLALAGAAAAGLTATGTAAVAAPVRQTAPTTGDLAKAGKYQVATKTLKAKDVHGFGGATMYYPSDPDAGTRYGIVVAFPGFTETSSTMAFLARRFASHGFLVFSADAFTTLEDPEARADLIIAALAEAKRRPEWAAIADTSRTALVGHSMGGGGVLTAGLRAHVSGIISVHPWSQRRFESLTAPTLVIGGSIDATAPIGQYSTPIYESLHSCKDKGYLVRKYGTHWAGIVDDPRITPRMLAFLKLFVDGDERYRAQYTASAPSLTTWQTTTR